jgi:hypothetical protein
VEFLKVAETKKDKVFVKYGGGLLDMDQFLAKAAVKEY